jgi:hypothetical protein
MMSRQSGFLLLAALAAAGLLSCARQGSTTRQLPTPSPGPVKVARYGSACRSEGVGPVGYLSKDIGKWGVPNPSPEQLALLAKIHHYDRSETLRFAFIERGPYVPQFIVYDNGNDACSSTPLLNGARSEYYEPQEPPDYVVSTPEGGTPYPWSPSSP